MTAKNTGDKKLGSQDALLSHVNVSGNDPFLDESDLVGGAEDVGSASSDDGATHTLPGSSKTLVRSAAKRQEFFLPIHDFVWFHPEEIEVIDHPAFQRLGGMHQLGLAHFVYRGATHRRLEHALGTVHTAQQIIEAVRDNCLGKTEHSERDQWCVGCQLSKYEARFIRLAALLHDIGHVPFGHTFEDELHLLNKHDERARLDKVLGKTSWYDEPTESLGDLVDRLYQRYVPKGVPDQPSELLKRIILHKKVETSSISKVSTDVALATRALRLDICGDIVGNTICADLLDYIYRDWYHVGKPKHVDNRIFQYMSIRTKVSGFTTDEEGRPRPTSEDRFVINIGNRPNLRTDGVTAIITLLESRYELAEAVLFHRTKMTATAMLERALILALPPPDPHASLDFPELVQRTSSKSKSQEQFSGELEDWLISHAEEELIPALCEGRAPFDGKFLSTEDKLGLAPARKLASQLLRRDLYNRLFTVTSGELLPEQVTYIQNRYGDQSQAAANRARSLRRLEKDFDLPHGSIAMYCPESRMNSKIAQVRLFVEGEVHRFDEYEKTPKTEDKLSRGHLRAQLRRFDDLWRIVFFVDNHVHTRKTESFWSLVREAIRLLILGLYPAEESLDAMTSRLAQFAVNHREFHGYGKTPLDKPKQLEYARQDPNVSDAGHYPTDARSLLSFIE